jgi:mannonate dehydratase
MGRGESTTGSEPTIERFDSTRRGVLGPAGLTAASLAMPEAAARARQAARRGRPAPKITDVRTILTQPGGEHLVLVKALISKPGLYGVGCATHGERPLAVAAAIDQHVTPLLVGKECDWVEDIWQTWYVASYFRSGVTLNNALSGVDGALWDILGKQMGLPVYKLLGGKVREAVPLYAHASARELPALEDQVRRWQAEGYRHVRVQLSVPGYATYGAAGETSRDVQRARPAGIATFPVFEPTPYVNNTIKMIEHLRAKLGFDVELLHDSTSACRRPRPSSWRRPLNPTGCSSWRTASRRRMRPASSTSARRHRPRWRWTSCSSTGTSGCRW